MALNIDRNTAKRFFTSGGTRVSPTTGKITTSETEGDGEETTTPPEKPSTATEYEKLLGRLVEIDNKYSTQYIAPVMELPESLDMEKLTYNEPTKAELNKKAKTALEPNYVKKKSEVEVSKKKSQDALHNQMKEKENERQAKLVNLATSLTEKLKQVQNAAVSKGTARGSIMQSAFDEAEQQHSRSVGSVTQEFEDEKALIEDKLTQIEEQAQLLLIALNNAHDAELAAEVTKLLEEVKEKKEEVLIYNNKLAEKENKFLADTASAYEKAKQDELRRVLDVVSFTKDIGVEGAKQLAQQEKYRIAKAFFDELPPEEAWNYINVDSALMAMLGDYYANLYAYVKIKAGK